MRRQITALVVIALAGGMLAACGNPKQQTEDKLLAAIAATEKQARKYTYTDTDVRGVRTQVEGVVEDDFRHKERLTIGSEVAADEVVSDDALAMRVTSDAALAQLVNRDPALITTANSAAATAESDTGGANLADSLNALKKHEWVLDPAGAPPLIRPASIGPGGVERDPVTGDDALLDALDVFNYARRSISAAFKVQVFNPDDINYKPTEDPFPTINVRGPITRYDLVRPFLPSATLQGARSNLPGPQNFRRMSIYVEKGKVVEIEESIYPAERLKSTIDRGVAFLKKAGASAAILSQTRALKKAPAKPASIAIIGALNVLRERNGDVPIRLRTMKLVITDLGGKNLHVLLPPDVTRGPLDILKNRGRTASINANAPTSGSTTTTVPGAPQANIDSGFDTTTTPTSAPPP